jgi:chemotaxis protein methyltransferase CheR
MRDDELQSLFQAVFERYGWDFRSYARASLRRRVIRHMVREKSESVADLRSSVLADPAAMDRLFISITVHVSAMFRDPDFYVAFRRNVVPALSTYPYLRFWIAGTSTGEEAYSLAILLNEEGLYAKSRIYATDISDIVVERAKSGIYPLSLMREFTQNYQAAGGTRPFGEYYTADSENAVLRPSLRSNMLFAVHNLAGDASFNEFHVIFCRNVMIYFERSLQNRVHALLHSSLMTYGYLGLGRSESIRFSEHESDYETLGDTQRLYRTVR